MSSAAPLVFDEHALIARLTRASFWEFVKEFWECIPGAGTMKPNWHMEVLCDEIQCAAERVFQGLPKEHNLITNISPGTSKSSIFSILFPCWAWTRMSGARILTASHASDLALDLANKSREVILSEKYRACFPEIEISKTQDAKSHYRNTAGGERLICTVAGKSPIGFHAHFQIVDDPIDPKKAASDAEIKTAQEFFDSVLATRMVDKEVTTMFLVMQRLHEDDPTGYLLKKARKEGAAQARHICLPAEIPLGDDGAYLPANVSPPELASRYIDGLMDPVRLSRKVLEERKTDGVYAYSSQFIQSPVPLGGGMFKDWMFLQTVKAAPYASKRIRYWDRACLVADTLVLTGRGDIPIQDVIPGDVVLTRQGWKPVIWSGVTKFVTELTRVEFDNGAVLEGTGDHPIWTDNRGWVELAAITHSDYARVAPSEDYRWRSEGGERRKTPKSLSLTACDTPAGPGSGTSKRTLGTRSTKSTSLGFSTGMSGSFTTAPSLKVTTFTTRMRTGTTTISAIWSACPALNIIGRTTRSPSGTKPKRLGNFGNGTSRRLGRTPFTETSSASSAATSFSRETTPRSPNTALPFAENALALEVSPRSAKCATSSSGAARAPAPAPRSVQWYSGRGPALSAKSSMRKEGPSRNTAPRSVALLTCEPAPVYDLTVADAHEFFANGILVHNSTADGGAYTAGVLMARDADGSFFVEHCVHGQWNPDERNEIMLATAKRDRRRYGPKYEPVIYVEYEGGSSGRDAFKGIARKLAGFNVREDRVTGDKDHRAEPWSAQLAARNVYFVEDGTWDLQNYIDEHLRFKPDTGKRGKYKDQVDASSGSFNLLIKMKREVGRVVVPLRERKKTNDLVRVLACDEDSLRQLEFAGDQAIIIRARDPRRPAIDESRLLPCPGGIHALADFDLPLPDTDPAEHQEDWDDDFPVCSPEQALKFWTLLFGWKGPAPSVIILTGSGRLPPTLARAFADALRLPDENVLFGPETPDVKNEHVYELVKRSKARITG